MSETVQKLLSLVHPRAYHPLSISPSRWEGEKQTHEHEDLLAHVLGVERAWLFAHPETRVHPSRAARFRRLATRLRRGEPLAQILGEQWFYGRPFRVTRDVLIPRPETEMLVELVVRHIQQSPTPSGSPSQREGEDQTPPYPSPPVGRGGQVGWAPLIVDIGTGSGCIAITIAAEIPHARVIATDISPAALRVARTNAHRNGVANRITFLRGDLLTPIQAIQNGKKQKYTVLDGRPKLCTADSVVVIANLPYLTTAEWRALPHSALPTPLNLRGTRRASLLRLRLRKGAARGKPRSLRTYEPRTALDGGPDGLTPYRALFTQLRQFCILHSACCILLEIDPHRRPVLTHLTRHLLPDWHPTFHRDLAGRWRVMHLERG